MKENFQTLPTNSNISERIEGSPPVNLILFTPSSTNIDAIFIISDDERSWSLAVKSTPFAGIQY